MSNLQDFEARIDTLSFVFNVNDFLLKENSFFNSNPSDIDLISLPQRPNVLLTPHLLTILEALEQKHSKDPLARLEYLSNFDKLY